MTPDVGRVDLPKRVADALDLLCLAADDAAGHLDDPDLDVVRAALDGLPWATVALDVATTWLTAHRHVAMPLPSHQRQGDIAS